MIQQSESVAKLFAALVAAQAEMRNPPKESVNPHFKSRFADLATVIDTVKPVLTKHGLGVIQMPCEVEGVGPALTTMLIHSSGEYVRDTIALRPAKPDPQGVGAAMTYARRYGLQAVLGITADDDDDGHNAARSRQQNAPQPKKRPTDDELRVLLASRGWGWVAAIKAMNVNHNEHYPLDSKPENILTDHLGDFADWLRTQPEVQKAN